MCHGAGGRDVWEEELRSFFLLLQKIYLSMTVTYQAVTLTGTSTKLLFPRFQQHYLSRLLIFILMSLLYHFNRTLLLLCLLYRSNWPRGLRRRSTAFRLLESWFQIPPGAWKFVCCEFCVLSGRGLCDELAPRPGKSYRLWCVVVCDLETSWMRIQNKAGWTVGRRLQQIDNVAI